MVVSRNKNKMGRPKAKELKKTTTIRLYEKQRRKLEKKFGGIQKAIDFLINDYFDKK